MEQQDRRLAQQRPRALMCSRSYLADDGGGHALAPASARTSRCAEPAQGSPGGAPAHPSQEMPTRAAKGRATHRRDPGCRARARAVRVRADRACSTATTGGRVLLPWPLRPRRAVLRAPVPRGPRLRAAANRRGGPRAYAEQPRPPSCADLRRAAEGPGGAARLRRATTPARSWGCAPVPLRGRYCLAAAPGRAARRRVGAGGARA